MPNDPFATLTPGLQSPAVVIDRIDPDDQNDLARVTRALNVATSGIVHLVTVEGSQGDVFITAGVAFPIRVRRILATGTTATGIRGLS